MSLLGIAWNIRQQREIADAQYQNFKTKQDLGRSADRIGDLEAALEHMTLLSQSLWELLAPRLEVNDAELLAKMEEIKHRSATKAPAAPAPPAHCASCTRPLGTNAARCIYCGSPVPKATAFA